MKNKSNVEKLAIRLFREELQLTRPQVTEATNIAVRTLADIESGKSIPTVPNVIALARLYRKSLKQILSSMELDVTGIPDDLPMKKQN